VQQYCTKYDVVDLFDFPKEPFHMNEAVGEPLILSSLIQEGQFSEAKRLSRVTNLNESAAVGIESFTGFIAIPHPPRGRPMPPKSTLQQSNIFFWFFPAETEAAERPLVIWLQVNNNIQPDTGCTLTYTFYILHFTSA
jgi:hypothetical protein